MSLANVEVVRRFTEPMNREDLVPSPDEMVQLFRPECEPGPILACWAEHPVWRHAHPEIVWSTDSPLLAQAAAGPSEVVRWCKEWVEVWESYVYTTVELRDLGTGF